MKIRIKKNTVIHFNILYVYFLKNGKVYRGRRGTAHNRGLGCTQSYSDLWAVPSSIKEIKFIKIFSSTSVSKLKTIKALKKHGVKIIK